MDLHIDNCIRKYKESFPLKDNSKESEEIDIDKKILTKEKYDEFERFFFIEMNNDLFSGEYLRDDYINLRMTCLLMTVRILPASEKP